MRTVDVGEFRKTGLVVLMDLEFTCWEGSLQSDWSDPRRPAEVIEVGLATLDLRHDRVLKTFSSMVRPRRNPGLSEYCTSLLRISQQEIDHAPPLPEVVGKIVEWSTQNGARNAPTCSWGAVDRVYLSRDAARSGCSDPFDSAAHADLRVLMETGLVPPLRAPLERDEVRAYLRLSANQERHRALGDALDLAQFCRSLRMGLVAPPPPQRTASAQNSVTSRSDVA